MKKKAAFWGSFVLAVVLMALPLVIPTSAEAVAKKAPEISMPTTLSGQVGVPFSTSLNLTGDGYPLPTLSVTPSSQAGISVGTSNLNWTGISTFSAKVNVTGTPTAAGTYSFTVKAENEKGSDSKTLVITVAPAPIHVVAVFVSPDVATLAPGHTVYLTATLSPDNATNQVVTWSSSHPAIATVAPSGLVTAINDGATTITATTQDGNKTDTATITVSSVSPPVSATDINVTPSTVNLDVGDTYTLNVHFEPHDATNQNVTWSSSAPGVVSVAADGTIVGLTPGEADVTATAQDGGWTSYSHVKVKAKTVNVSGIAVTPKNLSLYTGATAYLSAIITPVNATNQTIIWDSTAPAVASVDQYGLVTTLASGDVTITATAQDGGLTDTASISVRDYVIFIPVSGVTLSPSTVTLNSGDTRLLIATVLPNNATSQDVTWSTSDAAVASIAPDGTLTALSGGTTRITVTTLDGNKTAICDVTVVAPPTPVEPNSILLTPIAATIRVTENLLISYDIEPSNAHNKMVTWLSTSTDIATVDSTGLVTGVASGEVTIVATTQHGNKTASCDITVIPDVGPSVPVASITMSPKTLTLTVNDSAILSALISPDNASNQQVDWSSNAPLVASVAADGTVIGLAPGTATITVTTRDSGKTDTCVVTVLPLIKPVTGVTLSLSNLYLNVAETQTLTPTITPADASNKNLYWDSANPLIAAVDEDGKVTGIAPGTTTVTVTTEDGGKQATCTVTVRPSNYIPVHAIQVIPSDWAMFPDETKLLGVIFFPDSATEEHLTWTSSSNDIATVNANGLVTAHAPGYVVITATTVDNSSITSTCGIAVLEGDARHIDVDGVDILAPVMSSLKAGNTRRLLAELDPPNAEDQIVYWSSSNPAVATVGTDGLVTIVGPGTVTITVTTDDGEYTDSITFTVPGGGGGGGGGGGTTNVPVVRVDLSQTKVTLQDGQTFTLLYTISPSNATNHNVVWTNSSPDIISFSILSEDVALSGELSARASLPGILVKAVDVGQSLMTVTTQDGQKTASCLFTVVPASGDIVPVTSVTVSPTALSVETGESEQLTATVLPANATNKRVLWTSSNTQVALVNGSGLVSGVAAGTATITATTEDGARTATSAVTVTRSDNGGGGSSGCNSGFAMLTLVGALGLVVRKKR